MPPRVTDTYRKDTLHPAGFGYGRQLVGGAWVGERMLLMSSVVVHTTNNSQKNTKIWNECTFIRDSKDVSCHAVIGKDGTVNTILPDSMVAWHAGVALPAFTNGRSKGYELHCSVGEVPTQTQKDSLAWCIRQDIATYKLGAEDIDTHRAVALPKGRKSDPEGWPDADFYKWRDGLFLPTEPELPFGTVPVDPRLKDYWERSGGLWQPDKFALGYAVRQLDPATGVQLFERGGLRLNPDGRIDALLLREAVELLP